MPTKLYSYIIRLDAGSAPNPFWGTCTLTICKPDIRRTANVGDWIVATGSKNALLKDGNVYDLSDSVVYAMRVTKKLTLAEYDKYCKQHLKKKIPKWSSRSYRLKVGDCIYDYSQGRPKLREGVHTIGNKARDLRGQYALLSMHFYYFGEEPRTVPLELNYIIKRGQKHLVFDDAATIKKFEKWISRFSKNKLYADPQLRYLFDDTQSDEYSTKCATRHL